MYLLDTNALIILLFNDQTEASLTKVTEEIVQTEDNLFISVISLWEIAIKTRIGKLNPGKTVAEIVEECINQGIKIIPVKIEHLDETMKLVLYDDHKDAFDRMIISTAIVEKMTLVTTDKEIRCRDYGIKVVW